MDKDVLNSPKMNLNDHRGAKDTCRHRLTEHHVTRLPHGCRTQPCHGSMTTRTQTHTHKQEDTRVNEWRGQSKGFQDRREAFPLSVCTW